MRRNVLLNSDDRPEPTGEPAVVKAAPLRGAVGAMRDSLARMQTKPNGEAIVELDPASLEAAFLRDRFDENDGEFASFRESIAENGQKVPILVRPHAERSGAFQIAYGHRRHRACLSLGIKVRAVVQSMSDAELLVAQGAENSARQDLTWIERALFAWRLGEAGIKPKAIRAALTATDAELTRFRTVCRAVPSEIIEKIGRAPRVGRPRWLDLAKAIEARDGAVPLILKTLPDGKVSDSDERFRLALACLKQPKSTASPFAEFKVRVEIEKTHEDAFSTFLHAALPELLTKFFASRGVDKP